MIAYLLHKCSETERQEFEDRWMQDSALFEQLQDTEAGLLDAYARGELSALDRDRVEKYLLGSPAQRQKLHFAQALGRTFAPAAPNRRWRSAAVTAAIAAGVLLASATAFLAIDNVRLSRQLSAAAHATAPAPAPPVFLAELRSDSTTRSAASTLIRFQLPSAAQAVRLDLQLDAGDENQVLAASLSRDGVEIWKEEPVRAERRDFGFAAPLWIPAADLKAGEYSVNLTAQGSLINDYRFAIVTASPTK